MGRYRGPKCKLSRRAKTDLFLKSGARSIESKCKLDRIPGQHWQRRGRLSDYGLQLRMKNTIRYYYGLSERQFKIYYSLADKKKGSTGVNLMVLLERRLDNVVYRMGFAATRAEARQLVSHGAILINGEPVNIPSFLVKLNDIIAIREKSKKQARIAAALKLLAQRSDCPWLETDTKKMQGAFKAYPDLSDLPTEFKVNLVVELYSK